MKKVRKAVIPAAGLGTRFLPVTKSMPKEMLPIIDVPVIHFVVTEALASGVEDIIIITGRGKRAIEDYFDDAPELEMHLSSNGKEKYLQLVQEISAMADLHYIRQKEPKGLGHAVLQAEKHISGEPFAVLLGDDIIRNDNPCTRQLININEERSASVIAVEEVPPEMVSNYGIISGREEAPSLYRIDDIVEKPPVGEAPSNTGAIGRYVFTPEIFDCLKETPTGVGGEVQLTDAIRLLKGRQPVYAYKFKGRRYDTGSALGYLEAIIDAALEKDGLREDLLRYMGEVMRR